MEKLPKIVEECLKAGAVAVDHPDADVLTAFSERALPEGERSRVLEHLARCGECRDVIALSLPAEEPVVTVLRPVGGRWLTWPRLRWGLVAAGVIVVGSFGLLRYRETSRPAMVASYASRAEGVTKAKNETEPLPAAPEAARSDEQKKVAVSSAKSNPAPEENREFDRLDGFSKLQTLPRDKEAGGRVAPRLQSLPHGPKPPAQQWQQNGYGNSNNNNNAAYAFQTQVPAPAVPPAFARAQPSNQVVVSSQAGPLSAGGVLGGPIHGEKKVPELNTLAVAGKSSIELQPSGSNAGAEVARAKPAEPTTANAPKPQAPGAYDVSTANGSNFSQMAALAPESARWSINALGGLQRSLDQGKTWEDVDVNAGLGAGRGANLQYALKSSREKALAKDKADAKEAAAIVFRAVSANGPDVWAGGSSGTLYHSTDAGEHWVRVTPSWSGVELTDDIISLQFADPQRGRILTSSSEIWTTADAGQTWQKH